ncbi:ribosomal L14 protein [Hordeum vulgare]|nr:ribosomal L14 protein [Hordeum vulgare]
MAAAGDAGEKKMITLKSSDGEEVEVEEAVAMESHTIPDKNVLEAVAMEPPPRAILPRQRRSPTGPARSGDPPGRARPSGQKNVMQTLILVYVVGRAMMGSLGNNLYGGATSSIETVARPSRSDAVCQGYKLDSYDLLSSTLWGSLHETYLKVVDNSGANRVMCIQSLRGKKGERLGDMIIGSVKEAQPRGKVKKGGVVYGVVVRAAMKKGRSDGNEVQFDDNAIVIVNNKGELIGTRVFGPVPHDLRKKKHLKILALAEHIV